MRRRSSWIVPTFLGLLMIAPIAVAGPSAADPFAAPGWEIGDWWRIELQDERELRPVEARLVVSAVDKGDFIVGVEKGDSYLELLTYHFPFFGRVAGDDLSYVVHMQPFHPLQFPLTEGASWDTQFNDLELRAKVTGIQGNEAYIEYASKGRPQARATYNADARTITSWFLAGHGTMEVTDHGRGYACAVDYAPQHELLFLDYAMGSDMLPVAAGTPKTIEVHRQFDRAAIVMVAGGAEGLFSSAVMPPDGKTHTVSVYPHDVQRWQLAVAETIGPMGTWHVDSVAGSRGFALAEAMGFDLRSVDLGDRQGLGFGSPADCIYHAKRVEPAVAFAGSAEQGWAGAAIVAASIAGLVALWFGMRKSAAWFPPLALLYAKIPKERVLESRNRSDICELLKQQPGLTTQEIRRALEIGWGNTVHHLAILERAGLVVGTSWGHNRHWFLQAETPANERAAVSALRRDAARNVYDAIKQRPGISQEDLAKDLAIHHSTVFFHVERLMRANLVQKNRDGSRVRYYPTASAMTPEMPSE